MGKKTRENAITPVYLFKHELGTLCIEIEDRFEIVHPKEAVKDKSKEIASSELFDIDMIMMELTRIDQDIKDGKVSSKDTDHTVESLLNKLSTLLVDNSIVQKITSKSAFENIEPLDYIEIYGEFKKNPAVEYTEILKKMCDVQIKFFKRFKKKKFDDNIDMLKSLKERIAIVKKESEIKDGQIAIIEPIKDPKYRILLPMFSSLQLDGPIAIGSKYRVIGKVVTVVPKEDSLNMIREASITSLGTDLSGIFEKMFDQPIKLVHREKPDVIIKHPSIIVTPILIFE